MFHFSSHLNSWLNFSYTFNHYFILSYFCLFVCYLDLIKIRQYHAMISHKTDTSLYCFIFLLLLLLLVVVFFFVTFYCKYIRVRAIFLLNVCYAQCTSIVMNILHFISMPQRIYNYSNFTNG